jgi:uncharacterized protein YjiK
MDIKKLSPVQGRFLNLLFCSLIFFGVDMACITIDEEKYMVISSGKYSYSLNNPDDKNDLPGKLEEISGLDYLGDQILLCVDDEEGILCFYNTREKKVTREIKFGRNGDYEGVAHIDNMAYVTRSDGKLFEFPIDRDDDVEARRIDTPLTGMNDVEGLSAGHNKNELYLACKGLAEVDKNKIEGRAVYTFDLKNNQLASKPYIHLTTEIFKEALKQNHLTSSHHMPFRPSGITVHPLTGDVFIIASVGQLILVLNKSGKITGAAPLSRKIFTQPEGICFDEKGTLYISNEGKGKAGYILSFNPREIQK